MDFHQIFMRVVHPKQLQKNNMRSLFLYIFSFIAFIANTQDSLKEFTYNEFIEVVKNYHPISYQANLVEEQGQAKIRKARGGFDPKIYGGLDQKYFQGKQYYSHLNTDLKIPTWFGVSFQAGYDNNEGYYLSNELNTPDEGLWHAGVTINLGNGLFIDKRRAELNQAKIYNESSAIEKRLILNQLYYDASVAYLDWVKAYEKYLIYSEALKNAELRLQAVKLSSQLGDKPAIDTLKALIQVQDRQIKLEQVNLDLNNKKAQLEVFLWQDGFVPLEIDSLVKPDDINLINFSDKQIVNLNTDSLLVNHPELKLAENEVDIYKIDFRLKQEALKPVVELKYNALSGTYNNQTITDNYSMDNYNWGAKVVYPIFTRKERGDLKLTNLKLKSTEAKVKLKATTLKYKFESSANNLNSFTNQEKIYKSSVNNYKQLLDGELKLYSIGESSLFLVNTRDQNHIDSQIKLIDATYKKHTSEIGYRYQTLYW